jgi:hypothetical protein
MLEQKYGPEPPSPQFASAAAATSGPPAVAAPFVVVVLTEQDRRTADGAHPADAIVACGGLAALSVVLPRTGLSAQHIRTTHVVVVPDTFSQTDAAACAETARFRDGVVCVEAGWLARLRRDKTALVNFAPFVVA